MAKCQFGQHASKLYELQLHLWPKNLPFKELYTETVVRSPKKVGLFGYRRSHLCWCPIFQPQLSALTSLAPTCEPAISSGLKASCQCSHGVVVGRATIQDS